MFNTTEIKIKYKKMKIKMLEQEKKLESFQFLSL